MSEQIKGQLLNTFTGIISGLVVIFLDKQGLASPAYIVFGLYICVSILVLIKHIKTGKISTDSIKPEQEKPNIIENKELNNTEDNILYNILSLIVKCHSLEIPAPPKQIAGDLNIDTGVLIAYMTKYNNAQLITFRSNGKPPDSDTAFFLSPKAWELIQIVKA